MSRWQADVELVMCSVKTDGFGMTFLLWLQGEAPRAAPAVPMLGVLDPQPPRFGDAAPPLSVSQQADDVLNIIEYRTARRNVCDMVRRSNVGVAVSRGELACKLDELHILSLKSAVLVLEPKSAGEIGQMKSWAMNNLARPGQMAHCDDGTLFGFIASKLMAQDVSLAEESAIDDEFATYLSRSNSVRKSCLTTAMAQTAGMARAVFPPASGPRGYTEPHMPEVSPRAFFEGVHRGVRDDVQGRAPKPWVETARAASSRRTKWRGRTPSSVRRTTGPLSSVVTAAGDIPARYL
jgi:hypothetical protein